MAHIVTRHIARGTLLNNAASVTFSQKASISKSVQHFRRHKKRLTLEHCLLYPQLPAIEDKYEETPQYPPIFDPSPEGLKKIEREKWYSSIKAMPTVEEKLCALSEKRVKAYIVEPISNRFLDSPAFAMYSTRTQLIQGLPERYQSMNADAMHDKIKSYLLEMLKTEMEYTKHKFKTLPLTKIQKYLFTNRMIFELMSVLFRGLSGNSDVLLKSCSDYLPRCESYWTHSGYLSSKRKTPNELMDVNFQYKSKPVFQVRIEQPLVPFAPQGDPLCKLEDIKQFNYHPQVLNMRYEKRYLTSVPGFWPRDPCIFPLLSVHSRFGAQKILYNIKPEYEQDLINGAGILASFGWLNGLATYHGFTQFHDLTYPLMTQTIITDGQTWTFFAYQLNTVCFHHDVDTHSLQNLCWTSGDMKLYETYEDGDFKMLNDEVLKMLIKFFLQATELPSEVQLKPYLNEDAANSSETIREEVFTKLKFKYSNRPDHTKHKYEIPLWKHIYKRHPLAASAPWLK